MEGQERYQVLSEEQKEIHDAATKREGSNFGRIKSVEVANDMAIAGNELEVAAVNADHANLPELAAQIRKEAQEVEDMVDIEKMVRERAALELKNLILYGRTGDYSTEHEFGREIVRQIDAVLNVSGEGVESEEYSGVEYPTSIPTAKKIVYNDGDVTYADNRERREPTLGELFSRD